MSRTQTYIFQAADTSGIANLQTGTTLTLNGTYSDPTSPYNLRSTLSGFQRIVTLTSANDLSGTTITILGSSWSGLATTTSIAGPNAGTISTVMEFMSVTSVASASTLTGISIGWGNTGQSRPFTANLFDNPGPVRMQVNVTGTLSFSARSTMDSIQDSGVRTWVAHPALTGTATAQDSYSSPPAAIQIAVNSGNGGALTFRVAQAGK